MFATAKRKSFGTTMLHLQGAKPFFASVPKENGTTYTTVEAAAHRLAECAGDWCHAEWSQGKFCKFGASQENCCTQKFWLACFISLSLLIRSNEATRTRESKQISRPLLPALLTGRARPPGAAACLGTRCGRNYVHRRRLNAPARHSAWGLHDAPPDALLRRPLARCMTRM